MANEHNNTSCSICLNEFNKPKIIDCHHTFCESCLTDYVAKAVTNNQFLCPLCRKEITVPDGGVKDFSANFYIADTPQVPPQQTSRCMCTLHLREKELFCCKCCEAVCIRCCISGHAGHSLETVHDVENKLRRELEQLREDNQANAVKDQETLTKCKKQPFKKEDSRAWLAKRMERSEALERKISTVLENQNLCEMLDEISKFGIILVSAKNVNTTDVVSRPIADTNCGELLAEDKENHATETDKLDERGDQNSLFRLRDEGSPNRREFESGELNYNLQSEDLNAASLRRSDLLDPSVPRQTIYFCGNTIIHSFHINLYGKKYTSLSSPTFDILGELWSLECKCEDRNRKSINLRIYLKRMSVSSSSIFAEFAMVISRRTGTESVAIENGFNFTRRSNVYQCSDLQLEHDNLIYDNAITVTVFFYEVKVPSRSGIYFSRVPVIKTSALGDLLGILILFVLTLILIKLIT
ncbi:hypothetical protein SNE40_002283 [Patella caerulea]|uniref:RING-type domain-containing protein n=1 Tax=Patella caerulea TaxID=87958 RepID=A0AAN8KD52_PATCE